MTPMLGHPELISRHTNTTILSVVPQGLLCASHFLHAQSYLLSSSPTPFMNHWRALQRKLFFADKSSLCSRYQETTYKIVSRWYRTPSILTKWFLKQSDRCWRCGSCVGTLLHIFWECPFWVHFGTQYFTNSWTFLNMTIPKQFCLILLLYLWSATIGPYSNTC